ncbi:alpha/beta hydrolase fold protein [Wilcoxina mikolae CBS 423.85]|nr:alpha/beta hydrolase fold protein [Wilcoxina mikolae CBS 423.85]
MSAPEGFTSGYVPVNGLSIYYEERGTGGVPLLMLHGAFCTISDLRTQMTHLSKTRRVLALEYQAHGHTADIPSRPLTYHQLADDCAAFLSALKIPQADIYGYSLGGGIAEHLAIRHPEVVRKLVLASTSYSTAGFPAEMLAGLKEMTYERMAGSRYETEYQRVAPDPEGFKGLVERIRELNNGMIDIPEEEVRGIKADTFVLVGDADVVRTEHVVEMFKLRGGGQIGDMMGLSKAQLAVLPGTSHVGMMERKWVAEMVEEFLERKE